MINEKKIRQINEEMKSEEINKKKKITFSNWYEKLVGFICRSNLFHLKLQPNKSSEKEPFFDIVEWPTFLVTYQWAMHLTLLLVTNPALSSMRMLLVQTFFHFHFYFQLSCCFHSSYLALSIGLTPSILILPSTEDNFCCV